MAGEAEGQGSVTATICITPLVEQDVSCTRCRTAASDKADDIGRAEI